MPQYHLDLVATLNATQVNGVIKSLKAELATLQAQSKVDPKTGRAILSPTNAREGYVQLAARATAQQQLAADLKLSDAQIKKFSAVIAEAEKGFQGLTRGTKITKAELQKFDRDVARAASKAVANFRKGIEAHVAGVGDPEERRGQPPILPLRPDLSLRTNVPAAAAALRVATASTEAEAEVAAQARREARERAAATNARISSASRVAISAEEAELEVVAQAHREAQERAGITNARIAAATRVATAAEEAEAELAAEIRSEARRRSAATNARITAAQRVARAAFEAEESLTAGGTSAISPERQAIAQQVSKQNKRLAVIGATLRNEEGLLDLSVQRLVQNRELLAAERQLAKAEIEQAIASGRIARGTLWQRAQAWIANRQGGAPRLPTEFARGGQTLAGSLITTGRFALSGLALYGTIAGVTKLIGQAQNLERIFNQIRRQFESLGRTDQFAGFRAAILQISRDTGSAAEDVAAVGFQFQGAFGGNTTKALLETQSAFEAVKVTGLEIHEVIDAFTSLTQNFTESNVTIREVSDTALGLQERFGVLAKETISFSADLAPVASQAGFTVKQLEALGAVAQKYSGRTGSSLAEAFGRIIPQIQGNAAEFLQLFQEIGGIDLGNKVAAAFRSGDTSAFFDILLQQYPRLSKSQKDYTIELLGGRREAQALIPVLEHSGELLAEYNRTQSDAGKTSQYFSDLQQTLKQRMSELSAELTQLGVKLFESGIGDFLKDTIGLATNLVGVIGTLTDAFGLLSNAIGSIPGIGGAAGGGLSTILEGLLLYGGLKAFGGGVKGGFGAARAGRGITGVVAEGGASAVAASGLTGIRAQTAAGFKEARLAAQLEGAGAAGAAARGLSGGIKGAFASFNWGAIGLTAAALMINQISVGIKEGNQKYVEQAFAGTNSLDERLNSTLTRIGIKPTGPGAFSDIIGQELKRNPQATLNDLIGNLKEQARAAGNDAGQGGLEEFYANLGHIPGVGNLSSKQTNREALIDKIKPELIAAQLDQINAFLSQGEDVWVQYAKNSLGTTTTDLPSVTTTDATGSHTQKQSVTTGPTAEQIQKFIEERKARISELAEKIRQGDATLAEMQELANLFSSGGDFGQAIEQIAAQERAKQADQANRELEILTSQEVLSKFDSGDIGISEAKRALDRIISNDKLLGYDTGNSQQRKELADLVKRRKTIEGEALLKQIKEFSEVTDLTGSLSPEDAAQADVTAYINVLKSGKLTPEQSKEASRGVLNALKAVQDARIAATDDAALQAKYLAEGIPVPEAVQAELVYEYLTTFSTEWQDFLFVATGGIATLGDAVSKTTSVIFAQGGKTFVESARLAIQLTIDNLKAQREQLLAVYGYALQAGVNLGDTIKAFSDAIAKLEGEQANLPDVQVPDYSSVGKNPSEAAQKAEQAADERAKEEAALRAAQRDLLFAQSGDPIQAAQNAIADAQDAEAIATTASEKVRAQAARVRAQHDLAHAIADVGNAQLELAQAVANAAGDSIEAARIGLELAKRKLAEIQATTPGDQAAILRAQADVVTASSALVQTTISEGESSVQTDLILRRITKGQAIAELQALYAKAQSMGASKKELDQIAIEIQNLKGSLGEDFKYNLPSVLGLPTLYEARRTDQTPGAFAGIGASNTYDNRSYTITINTASTDPQAVADAVQVVIGNPNAYSTGTKRYP